MARDNELRSGFPQAIVKSRIVLPEPVRCDRARIGQLLSNLLANALTHGEKSEPVEVSATASGNSFELSVANAGQPIEAIAKLEELMTLSGPTPTR